MEREYTPGKQGRAAGIEEEQAAPTAKERENETEGATTEAEKSPAEVEELISPETIVHTSLPNMIIFDLYEVGHESVTRKMCTEAETEIPFAHQIKIHGPQGEITQVSALFDGAAMVAAMCTSLFNHVKHRLGYWQPSQRRLRMANGTIVPSQA